MNIFKKLLDKAGKMALSGLQLAGLTAVVGAAGVGAWQYLSAPAEAPEFSLPQYNPGTVVLLLRRTGQNPLLRHLLCGFLRVILNN